MRFGLREHAAASRDPYTRSIRRALVTHPSTLVPTRRMPRARAAHTTSRKRCRAHKRGNGAANATRACAQHPAMPKEASGARQYAHATHTTTTTHSSKHRNIETSKHRNIETAAATTRRPPLLPSSSQRAGCASYMRFGLREHAAASRDPYTRSIRRALVTHPSTLVPTRRMPRARAAHTTSRKRCRAHKRGNGAANATRACAQHPAMPKEASGARQRNAHNDHHTFLETSKHRNIETSKHRNIETAAATTRRPPLLSSSSQRAGCASYTRFGLRERATASHDPPTRSVRRALVTHPSTLVPTRCVPRARARATHATSRKRWRAHKRGNGASSAQHPAMPKEASGAREPLGHRVEQKRRQRAPPNQTLPHINTTLTQPQHTRQQPQHTNTNKRRNAHTPTTLPQTSKHRTSKHRNIGNIETSETIETAAATTLADLQCFLSSQRAGCASYMRFGLREHAAASRDPYTRSIRRALVTHPSTLVPTRRMPRARAAHTTSRKRCRAHKRGNGAANATRACAQHPAMPKEASGARQYARARTQKSDTSGIRTHARRLTQRTQRPPHIPRNIETSKHRNIETAAATTRRPPLLPSSSQRAGCASYMRFGLREHAAASRDPYTRSIRRAPVTHPSTLVPTRRMPRARAAHTTSRKRCRAHKRGNGRQRDTSLRTAPSDAKRGEWRATTQRTQRPPHIPRNIETSKHRNVETSKHRNIETAAATTRRPPLLPSSSQRAGCASYMRFGLREHAAASRDPYTRSIRRALVTHPSTLVPTRRMPRARAAHTTSRKRCRAHKRGNGANATRACAQHPAMPKEASGARQRNAHNDHHTFLETSKHRNIETSKHRNIETSKQQQRRHADLHCFLARHSELAVHRTCALAFGNTLPRLATLTRDLYDVRWSHTHRHSFPLAACLARVLPTPRPGRDVVRIKEATAPTRHEPAHSTQRCQKRRVARDSMRVRGRKRVTRTARPSCPTEVTSTRAAKPNPATHKTQPSRNPQHTHQQPQHTNANTKTQRTQRPPHIPRNIETSKHRNTETSKQQQRRHADLHCFLARHSELAVHRTCALAFGNTLPRLATLTRDLYDVRWSHTHRHSFPLAACLARVLPTPRPGRDVVRIKEATVPPTRHEPAHSTQRCQKRRVARDSMRVRGRKRVTRVGFEPTPEDWCLKPAP
ncbi:hypothetical protein FI667_g6525, partial [Globisporangium splendens]